MISLILMAIGLIGLLAGYKIFKIFLALSAFILAFNLVFNLLPQTDYTLKILICLAAGGFAGVLSYVIYRIGIFLLWTCLAMELVRLGIDQFGINLGEYKNIGILVAGVLIGAVTLIFQIEKVAIIIATTISGAAYLILGLLPFLKKDITLSSFSNIFTNLSEILQKDNVLIVIFLVLIFIGLVVQFRGNFGNKGTLS